MGRGQLLERSFETSICEALAQRGWLYDPGAADAGWDPRLALHPADVLAWLREQYPVEYAKATANSLAPADLERAERGVLEHLATVLSTDTKLDKGRGRPRGGLLGVLHSGFDHAQIGRGMASFGPMAAFPPENPNITTAAKAATQNLLRVMRQVRFDPARGDTLDLVLTVNGIPVVTMELKTDNTQTVQDAMEQYRAARVPSKTRPLLQPGRALVHFAVSSSEVYMTTRLAGAATSFLPFNQGDEGHQGNPPSATGSDTDYLWREVLERSSMLRILSDYAFFQPGSGRGKASAKKGGTLVFPRYHQRRAVERVIADVESKGPGEGYLIWHSAGSGKTKTIAWLAHRLVRHMGETGKKTFDSVVVISDRNVLDRNLRDGIALLRASEGLVVNIGSEAGAKSQQLRRALTEGGHIITCTLQTFPEVLGLMNWEALDGRSWCVIADEAHSSQTGSASTALRKLLGAQAIADENGELLTGDDLLLAQGAATAGVNRSITYVALTATPKAKTLRLFGRNVAEPGAEPCWEAFDTYSMAQAIEEGFILDVLRSYSTYAMFARVRDRLGQDQEVEVGAAVSDIVAFVRLHPTAISQKVRVVVEHFRRNVMHHLGGHAKAMVVTESRAAAVAWSRAMNEYIASEGYTDMRTLVAFSGSLEEPGSDIPITEAGLNQRSDTENAFREEESYKVLIVADKFQTGFDEPRLCAMYVDKKLSGITAVQTLSRLNRIMPGKPTPMVVDFRNEPESIQADFKLYYSDAHVEGEVDPNVLTSLKDRIEAADYVEAEEIEATADAFLAEKGHEEIQRLVSPIRHRWEKALRVARDAGAEGKDHLAEVYEFRSNLGSYRHAWEFLSQITDYGNPGYQRLAIFTAIMERNLHLARPSHVDYASGLSLVGVELTPSQISKDVGVRKGEQPAGGIDLPTFGGKGDSGGSEALKETFAEVLARINEMFAAAGISVATQEGFVRAMWGRLVEDPEFERMTSENGPERLMLSGGFTNKIVGAAVEVADGSQQMLGEIVNRPDHTELMVAGFAELAAAAHKAASWVGAGQ